MQRQWRTGLVSIVAGGLVLAAAGCSTAAAPAKMSAQPAAAAAPSSTQPAGLDLASTQPASSQPTILKIPVNKVSYSYGVQLGRGFKKQGIELNPEAVALGMKDAMEGNTPFITEDQIREAITALQTDVKLKQRSRNMKVEAVENKRESDAFMAQNKTKEGVITLPSGLQYKVLKTGSGPHPTDSDVVECYYRGTLIDGTEFDSTMRVPGTEGEPSLVKVSDTIPGWREALPLMSVGSKWQLFVPPDLGYSGRGSGKIIGPNEALIFDIELVAVKAKIADKP